MIKIYELEARRNFCFEFLLYLVSDLNINRAGISWEKLILIDERAHNEEWNWIFIVEKVDIEKSNWTFADEKVDIGE